MALSKNTLYQIFQGALITLIFWTAKWPFIFLVDGLPWVSVSILGMSLFVWTLLLSALLFTAGMFGASIYQLFMMLSILPISLVHGNDFGVYKAFSIILMMNLVTSVFFIKPSIFSVRIVLLTSAMLFLFYGVVSMAMLFLLGESPLNRGKIGFNGPIVFAQYMVFTFAVLLLHSKRFVSFLAFGMAIISQSKGPILAGLGVLLMTSKNKRLLLLLFFPIVFGLIFFFGDQFRAVSWIKYFMETGSLPNSGSFVARAELYRQAIGLLATDSVGLGGWADLSHYSYPHNIFIEVLVELPILLAASFLLIHFVAFMLIKDASYRVLFVLFLFMAQFSGSLIDNRAIFLVTLLFLLENLRQNFGTDGERNDTMDGRAHR